MQKSITFFYPSGKGFSGQRFASELLISGLRQRGWSVFVVPIPTFDRVTERGDRKYSSVIQGLKIARELLFIWTKLIFTRFESNLLHINLGQTKFALLRDGFPLILKKIFFDRSIAIISLHGNLFSCWNFNFLEARMLRYVSSEASYITVLGQKQKEKLHFLGIPLEKIVLMDNTCSLEPTDEKQVLLKHNLQTDPDKPLTILYLSSLVESKGYPEFIEAVVHLSAIIDIPIKAILCGNISIGRDDSSRFVTHAAAKAWIEERIKLINQSPSVRLHWINGADGEEKKQLFRQAQIFVLPSRYKIEAQPITILEALASGCAVITTKIGEIPTTVSEKTAVLLDDSSPDAISKALFCLCKNSEVRTQIAVNGIKLFKNRFSYEKHLDRWEELLDRREC